MKTIHLGPSDATLLQGLLAEQRSRYVAFDNEVMWGMIDRVTQALISSEGMLPIPMLLWCPKCNERHIDEGEFATKPHHTHACQKCGLPWRPAIVPTVGVMFLPGFRNTPET